MGFLKGDDGSSGLTPPGTFGVWGDSYSNHGIVGLSGGPVGVYGQSRAYLGSGLGSGVLGVCYQTGGRGVRGEARDTGVEGKAELTGVRGEATWYGGTGVFGKNLGGGIGVLGWSKSLGVWGYCEPSDPNAIGVQGWCTAGTGVRAISGNIGLYAENTRSGLRARLATLAAAGEFEGGIIVRGGIKTDSIIIALDHPLDPANKYLAHACVESSDQKNLYDGIATLDRKGEAQIELPEWFTAVNRDFRYQLTCIGEPAAVFVAQEIEDNRFRIAGGKAGQKVCWQVTGIRQDSWANANPLVVEEEKPENERGTYLHPELYGQPEEKSVQWVHHSRPPELPPEPLTPPELPPEIKDLRPQEK